MGAATRPRQTPPVVSRAHQPSRGKDQGASPHPGVLDPTAQPAFLLGAFPWPQSPYAYPDSNNQVLEELSEESTVFFVSVAYNLCPTAPSVRK